MLLASPVANGQAFLNKLKDKAGNAIGNAISNKVNERVNEKVNEKVSQKFTEKTGVDINAIESQSKNIGGMPLNDSRETLQPKRSSSFGWDGVVTPSATKFPIPLMNEFPAVPSAAQLANPTEADQIAYYKAIKAVTLRAEELNKDTTCEDQFTEKWRAEAEKAIQDAYGLTSAEMEALKSGNLSQAEQDKLAEKMRANIMGDFDQKKMEEEMKQAEGMTQQDVENRAVAASCAVFDRHDAELRKYCGCTAEDYKKATRESMKSDNNAATKAIEKKSEAYIKSLPAAEQKEAQAFMKTLRKELMDAALNSTPGARSALQMSQSINKFEQKLSPMLEKAKKVEQYNKDIMAAWPQATWSDADAKFSESERKKIENIRAGIYATDNPAEYNALYLQAMEVIKTYRVRAAQVWAADVQKRFDTIKNGMGGVIKVQRQAIEDGIIPECSLWRVPLNLVVEAGDVLAEAYSEFPSNYPPMYNEEVVRQVTLQPGEKSWWPEFYVTMNLDDILSGKSMFKESNGNLYQFNKGTWTSISKDYGANFAAKETKPQSAKWTSSDGKREVVYNAEGGFLSFPEGDIVYPVAWEKRGNQIIWAEIVDENKADGSSLYKIVKCVYKL